MPDSGTYAVAPYASDSYFSTVRVGAYCIRPIRRPRQGDECGCPVISQSDLLGSSGPSRARFGGVCCCALHLRFLFFGRQGRGVLHTPYQTSPSRLRMRVPGYFAGQFIGGIRALPCPIRGRMQYAPTSPVDCMGSFCQSSDLDASSDTPEKGTNARTQFSQQSSKGNHPGPIVPVCGAYAVAPLPCRSIVWGHFANRPTLTPHQTSPTRGRRWVWGWDVVSVFGTAEGAEGA